jgi:hypothetical protein
MQRIQQGTTRLLDAISRVIGQGRPSDRELEELIRSDQGDSFASGDIISEAWTPTGSRTRQPSVG